jgi:hypothetical protein
MRIGTWNVANRVITTGHRDLLLGQNCDVWLLTELNRKWLDGENRIDQYHCHLSAGIQGRIKGSNQLIAAVLGHAPLIPLDDPHPASAAAVVDNITYCSTVLPWRSASGEPWSGSNHSEKTEVAIATLLKALPRSNLVWGGDWNHSLVGKEHSGSMGGRNCLLGAIKSLGLQVPTDSLLHRNDISKSIDHIGVPAHWRVTSARRIDAKGLSDHDAYVVETPGN